MPQRRTAGKSGQQAGKTGIGKAITNNQRRRADFVPLPRSESITGVSEGQAQRSVLEQSSLDDFLAQAALGSAVFPAEKLRWNEQPDEGVRLVGVLPEGGEAEAASNRVQRAAASVVVPIPWRPVWQTAGNAQELTTAEGEAFLDWRRDLSRLEQKEHVVMTPYERNLDFWRQLWRCCERSDLVVQIVDARDPYFYRSRDLERYLSERFTNKKHVLLMNKSDFLGPALRRQWAAHYGRLGVEVLFFSALRELHRQHRVPSSSSRWDPAAGGARGTGVTPNTAVVVQDDEEPPPAGGAGAGAGEPVLPPHGNFDADPDVLDTSQLLDEIRRRLPPSAADEVGDDVGEGSVAAGGRKGVVGFVGYPNVGKSSVINALYGAKKVSMSRTPGKTKHLQTLDLPGTDLTLCDCPGLVFPSVVATRAHLAINGTVPLVELRDSVQPVRLIVDKMGPEKIAAKYELTEALLKEGEQRLGVVADSTRRLLAAVALERKRFLRLGVPDETWAARRLLHDYCTGALLHCEDPPEDDAVRAGGAASPSEQPRTPAASAPSVADSRASGGAAALGGLPAVPESTELAKDLGEGGGADDDSDFSDLDAFLAGDASACSGARQKGRRAADAAKGGRRK